MQIQKNFSLTQLNTFGIEAFAKFYIEINQLDDLKNTLKSYPFGSIEYLILGGGSNILLCDNFDGLVLKNNLKGIEITKEEDDFVYLKVGAGENWHEFVLYCIKNNYAGVENLSLIPGTVGAAPMQNIGAYGVEIKDVFHELEGFHLKKQETDIFQLKDCDFGYRESVFKNKFKGQYFITAVTFKLSKTPNFKISYGDIQKTLEANQVKDLTIKAVSDAVISIRQSKLPDPQKIGNAGSFFKNPEISVDNYNTLKDKFTQMPSYIVNENTVKVPAGWLIEQAGWKGYREGNIGVHEKQALVLVNYGKGNGNDLALLSEKIKASVMEKFGIQLSTEVNFI
ncbi:MAG: UDP-N-acetylmuramate dehydrogenase [Pseudarcicella sp.]|nr:UDP-N-acetylmuramate dehydrogenase [Pseudarcicella sp.]MBP6409746.1 UDP-N-acetylmuramate dehydrogenase [Pseudarcicella sp.]